MSDAATEGRPVMTEAEAADYMRVSVRTLKTLRLEKGLPYARLGRRVVLRRDDCDAWLRSQTCPVHANGVPPRPVATRPRAARSGPARRGSEVRLVP